MQNSKEYFEKWIKYLKLKKIKWQKFKMVATHKGASKYNGGNIWGHQNIKGASKHTGGVQTTRGASKHMGGVQTYGGIKTYRRHPNIAAG